MTYRKTDVTLEIRINRHIMAAVQALADRDPGIDVAIIVRRAIMRELGLNQDAINLWEGEERVSRKVSISKAARSLIVRAVALSDDEADSPEHIEGLAEAKEELKALWLTTEKEIIDGLAKLRNTEESD